MLTKKFTKDYAILNVNIQFICCCHKITLGMSRTVMCDVTPPSVGVLLRVAAGWHHHPNIRRRVSSSSARGRTDTGTPRTAHCRLLTLTESCTLLGAHWFSGQVIYRSRFNGHYIYVHLVISNPRTGPPMPMCAMVCTTPDTRPRHSGRWHSARPGLGRSGVEGYRFFTPLLCTLLLCRFLTLYITYSGVLCRVHYNSLSSLKVLNKWDTGIA